MRCASWPGDEKVATTVGSVTTVYVGNRYQPPLNKIQPNCVTTFDYLRFSGTLAAYSLVIRW